MRFFLSWILGTCEHFEVDEYALLMDLKANGYTSTTFTESFTSEWWRPATKVSLAS